MSVLPSYTGLDTALPTLSGVAREFLDEERFRRALYLEGRRAERSQKAFLLLLFDVSRIVSAANGRTVLNRALSAVSLTIRETDIIGWHHTGETLGILFTEIPYSDRTSVVSILERRVNGTLYKTLGFDQFSQVSTSHHIFPEQWDLDVPQRPSHPTLYPELSAEDRAEKLFLKTKRAIDILGSLAGLLIASPLLLLIALAVRCTSRGPALFRQVRIGQYGVPFVFLKFRSMYIDNDPRVHQDYIKDLIGRKAIHPVAGKNGQPIYKLTRDPRVTKVGAFLRKTSLDELPQLYNVLKGDMSLVGPRPAIPYEVEAYEPWHRRRLLSAKPGITGLWQINGRSRVTFDEMVRLDVRYALARSIWLDLKILVSTPGAVIMGSGAY